MNKLPLARLHAVAGERAARAVAAGPRRSTIAQLRRLTLEERVAQLEQRIKGSRS